MLIIDIEGQVIAFVLSIVLGAVFCILYDFVRALHKLYIKGFLEVFVSDILFLLLCSVITFCFLVFYCSGIVRGFVIVGIILGFTTIKSLISKYILKFFVFVLKSFMGILHFVSNQIHSILVPINKYLKNYTLKVKKVLHMLIKVMYNQIKSRIYINNKKKGILDGNRS